MIIGNDVIDLANWVQNDTGLPASVVESHWYAEEGSAGILSNTSNWARFSNNPAGIRPGNPSVDKLSTGVNASGFLVFATPQAGAQAYATLISKDPNYGVVRSAIKTGDPNLMLASVAKSPWDSGHYSQNGQWGMKLFKSYEAVTGKPTYNDPSYTVGQAIGDSVAGTVADMATAGGLNVGQSLGFSGALQNVKWGNILVMIAGTVLIIMLMYRTVAK